MEVSLRFFKLLILVLCLTPLCIASVDCTKVAKILSDFDIASLDLSKWTVFSAGYFKSRPVEVDSSVAGVRSNVYFIDTTDGRAVVKFFDHPFFSNVYLSKGIVIQKALASVGLSPVVRGLVSSEVGRILGMSVGQQPYGVVMDCVPDPWVVKYQNGFGRAHPDFVRELDLEKIEAQFDEIERVFRSVSLAADDLQVLITRDSKVWLIDFDTFAVGSEGVSSLDAVNFLKDWTRMLVNRSRRSEQ